MAGVTKLPRMVESVLIEIETHDIHVHSTISSGYATHTVYNIACSTILLAAKTAVISQSKMIDNRILPLYSYSLCC